MKSSYHVNLIEYFVENIKSYSDKVAIIDGNKKVSFKELYCRVVTLSSSIKSKLHNQKNQIIAVMLPKSVDSIVADLAIMWSGNAYMNLDITNPVDRLNLIFSQNHPSMVISREPFCSKLQSFSGILLLDEYLDNIDESAYSEKFELKNIDTDPCCVINTSGSTGVPKSVILNHRSFIDFIEAVRYEEIICEYEIIASLSPSIFDIYSFELCMLMSWGCTIVIVPEHFAAFPAKLVQFLAEYKVSYLFWVPTIMVNIANMQLLDSFNLDSLKVVWFAGEVFPTAKFNYWKEHLPNTRFFNFYGPIEITLDCLFYEVKEPIDDLCQIPIGKPFRNTAVIVLDDDKEVDVGEEGELCIRGSSLAMGYYNNPEKTSAAFVQNPLNKNYPEIIYRTGDIVVQNSDGNFIFKGRKDTLIKRYGYRIELTEIEHIVVDALKIVKNSCVLYDSKTKDLILVYESEQEILPKTFQSSLKSILPKYMIPNKYIYQALMPRNANGKIDRNFLKQQYCS